jgi:hypothetical protein
MTAIEEEKSEPAATKHHVIVTKKKRALADLLVTKTVPDMAGKHQKLKITFEHPASRTILWCVNKNEYVGDEWKKATPICLFDTLPAAQNFAIEHMLESVKPQWLLIEGAYDELKDIKAKVDSESKEAMNMEERYNRLLKLLHGFRFYQGDDVETWVVRTMSSDLAPEGKVPTKEGSLHLLQSQEFEVGRGLVCSDIQSIYYGPSEAFRAAATCNLNAMSEHEKVDEKKGLDASIKELLDHLLALIERSNKATVMEWQQILVEWQQMHASVMLEHARMMRNSAKKGETFIVLKPVQFMPIVFADV